MFSWTYTIQIVLVHTLTVRFRRHRHMYLFLHIPLWVWFYTNLRNFTIWEPGLGFQHSIQLGNRTRCEAFRGSATTTRLPRHPSHYTGSFITFGILNFPGKNTWICRTYPCDRAPVVTCKITSWIYWWAPAYHLVA